jgi:O-antigen/teichoic acid export membrane protein
MIAIHHKIKRVITPEQFFMLSALVVNGGNYLYNLCLGRLLGPGAFADVAILITLLLVLSFVAMTFQLAVAKFTTEYDEARQAVFVQRAYKHATTFGVLLGAGIVIFATQLQVLFQTESSVMFTIFGVAVPLYFIMSVNRGNLQGRSAFIELSVTYQLEVIFRLACTFVFLMFFNISSSVAVSSAIAISFIAGVFPFKRVSTKKALQTLLTAKENKAVLQFFILTACYEGTQIICNNSDILLVKHYFPPYDAGLYASLALIGRVVYFVTWMFVMLLLPKVVSMRKQGENSVPVLMKYVGYITMFTTAIVGFTFLFPTVAVHILFGEQYMSIAPLLGWYALATSFFALSNIFAYYYLSLDHYKPIVIAALFGVLQIALIICFHNGLYEVVMAQVVAMGALLLVQLCYFLRLQRNYINT